MGAPTLNDPSPVDFASIDLPHTWPDELRLHRMRDLLAFVRRVLSSKRHRVELPAALPLQQEIPDYVLQEFHRMPNGNYSARYTKGYISGFDRSMLGSMPRIRQRMAEALRGCDAALDVGCGGGKLAQAFREAGIVDVWGIDASPYLLQIAQADCPQINFVQGLAERLPFASGRFQGVGVSFLFHEMPTAKTREALLEIGRVLQPGGFLVIAEPSPLQLLERNPFRLYRHGGWRAVYFWLLARFVYEPYVMEWHHTDVRGLLAESGFTLVEDAIGMPERYLLAQRL